MAVRINSDASVLKRTASVPSSTAFTLAGWFYFTNVTPARFWGPFGLMNAIDGVSGRTISSSASGSAQLSLEYTNSGGTFVTVPLLTVSPNQWYFLALTGKGNAIGDVAAYIRGLHDKTWLNAVTNTVAGNAFTAAALDVGREGFTGEFMDGDAFGFAAYDRAFTGDELMLLARDLLEEKAFRRARPNVYFRLRGQSDPWDWSGNARHPTGTIGINRPGLRIWPRRRAGLSSAATPGAMSGTVAWTWGQSGTLAGAGALAASVPWTWGQSATLRGSGALAGSSAWQWGQSGNLAGAGALAATVAWTWNQSGTLTGSGALAATAPWTWAQTGNLTNSTPGGAIAGTASWTWGQSATLTGAGALAGSIPWTWSQSANLGGAGALAGSTSWQWNQSGALAGSGLLAGTIAWQWAQSGALSATGALTGSTSWTWAQAGALTDATVGAIQGATAWTWDATGTLENATPQQSSGTSARRYFFQDYEEHRRRRERELRELERLDSERAEIDDDLDRQIAAELSRQEALDQARAEKARLQRLADAYANRPLELPPAVIKAIERAAQERTFAMLQGMQRELVAMYETQEMEAVALAALLLVSD